MNLMQELLNRFAAYHPSLNENGQDLAEYAILIGFVALVVVVGAQLLGVSFNSAYAQLAEVVEAWF